MKLCTGEGGRAGGTKENAMALKRDLNRMKEPSSGGVEQVYVETHS